MTKNIFSVKKEYFDIHIKPKTFLGAFGYFEVTHDITRYCKAKIFSKIGKRTPIAVRFSTVGECVCVCVYPYCICVVFVFVCVVYNMGVYLHNV